ncbi:MAG: BRCT domain-containing protein [Thermodesulfovibrionales bacterium]
MKQKILFNKDHHTILKRSGITLKTLTEERIREIISSPMYISTISDDELVEFLKVTNALYRGGKPIISDADYDFVFLAELRKRNPTHEFLASVEPEAAFEGAKVDLPIPMLSTEKKTSEKEIMGWLESIEKSANDIMLNVNELRIRVTPKLDGFAAYDDGRCLYTRGDGRRGTDISRVFSRGLAVAGGKRGLGAGEIVVDKEYFEKYLSDHFENSRNFQSSIIKEKTLDPYVDETIKEKAALFFPFSELPSWEGSIDELRNRFEDITEEVWNSVNYDVDGIIFEVTDIRLKDYMGSTSHHYRWQIAYKTNMEKARVKVVSVKPQTSRSGRVTPIAELEPTKLSGVTISRATAHHYAMVKEKGIGPGAIIELIRSGMVIPKIERVIKQAKPQIPDKCPSCGSRLIWDADNLICTKVGQCPAQIINTVEHFFKTLRNVDGFGLATIDKLFEKGVKTVYDIYMLKEDDFKGFGFGDKQSQNLVSELLRSRREPLEDWRFLAAFGVHRLGFANCEHLLQHVRLDNIFKLTEEDIVHKKIFAKKTAGIILKGLQDIRNEFERVNKLDFNLEHTKLLSELRKEGAISPIAGKQIIFTGTMKHGKRIEMEKEARLLRAKVAKSVTGRTDFLVTGEDVGTKKIETAKKKGVWVITEVEYLDMIKRYIKNKIE